MKSDENNEFIESFTMYKVPKISIYMSIILLYSTSILFFLDEPKKLQSPIFIYGNHKQRFQFKHTFPWTIINVTKLCIVSLDEFRSSVLFQKLKTLSASAFNIQSSHRRYVRVLVLNHNVYQIWNSNYFLNWTFMLHVHYKLTRIMCVLCTSSSHPLIHRL